jgi:cephalosporin hydroxylase
MGTRIRWAAGGVLLGAAAGAAAMHVWMSRPAGVVERFHRLYTARPAQTFNNTCWLGIPAQKTPLDLWVFQELIHRLQPDVIVETGTYKGGSSYFYASLCDLIGKGRVVTIDIEDYPGKPKHGRITFLHGSSTAPETLRKVRSLIQPGEKVMVFLDSAHSERHVREELLLYSPLVTPGSYLIVEDTHFNGHPILPKHGPGPWEAVESFLRSHPNFTADRSQEKFLLTFNPRGFLKRER